MNIRKLGAAVAAAVVAVSAVTITAFAAGTKVPITEKYFPDEIFREYVKQFDTDGNGSLSQKERDAVTEINVSEMGIKSLSGVSYFQNLEKLDCIGNELTRLNVSKNTKLEQFSCDDNKLTKLDLSKNTELFLISCEKNGLTELDLSKNTELAWFDCSDNQLTELDVSHNTKLIHLYCGGNKLTKLDVSKNKKLIAFGYDWDVEVRR